MGKYLCDVKGGMHAQYAATMGSMSPWSAANDHRYAAQMLAHKGNFEFRQLLKTLIGAAAGSSAAMNYGEIVASSELGGVRPVANTVIANRVTTSADVTDIKGELAALSANTYTASPPYNGDRNPLGTR